jgi:hypothetical protein
MPTFQITGPDGKQYRVSGENAEGALSALQQHIGGEAPAPADKYQQAAVQERDALKAQGVDTGAGILRRAIQGATFNTADEALAGLQTPLEMVRHGTLDPREGYNYAKAREDLIMEDARKNTGVAGTVAELGGGLMTGANLANAGLTAGRVLAPNAGLLARSGAAAADAAGMGAVAGAAEGNSFNERFGDAAKGAAIGAAAGGLTPAALRIAGAILSPVTSNVLARANPNRYAQNQVARAMMESNTTPAQIARDVTDANAAGQGVFTVADALGNPGQRMLSTVARSPGQGRTDVVDFLNGRQAGQSRRVANALAEGFDSPQSAAQTRQAMTTARDAAADAEYDAVRANGGQVDVVPTLNHLDQNIGTGPGQVLQAPNDSIEGVLRGFRERLARVNPDDFSAVQRIRGDMADAAQSAAQGGHGNRARMIGNAIRELDASMEAASPGFRQANANFRQASQNIDAIDQGRNAAMRGRTEDTIPAFQALPGPGQQAFRAGYADPLIATAQASPFGTNAARPLTSPAFQDEAAVMAPGNAQMQARIARENTMFETRNHALGGSRTADNLADEGAMGHDPTIIANLLMGHYGAAARRALHAGANALSGNTPEVRQEVGRILLQRGNNVTQQDMQAILQQAMDHVRRNQIVSALIGRGASGALAVGPSALGQR